MVFGLPESLEFAVLQLPCWQDRPQKMPEDIHRDPPAIV